MKIALLSRRGADCDEPFPAALMSAPPATRGGEVLVDLGLLAAAAGVDLPRATGGGAVDPIALAMDAALRRHLSAAWEEAATAGPAGAAGAAGPEALGSRFAVTGDLAWLPPVPRGIKIICLGRNYAAHAVERGGSVPGEPILFAKLPSALVGHREPIVIPAGIGRVDPEVELAAVIGRRARRCAAGEAMGHVAGYTVFNDVSARDVQDRATAGQKSWMQAKSADTFAPCGPYLVTVDEVADPHALTISLRVNGELRQSGSTGDMIFRLPHLIEYISRHITLEPGDIIATGTPAGVAPIHPGDVVTAAVERVGTLENPVRAGD